MTLAAWGDRADEHALTDLVAGHARAELFDDADRLVAQDEAGANRVFALDDVDIGPTDGRERDPDQGLTGSRARPVNVLDAELLRCPKDGGPHRVDGDHVRSPFAPVGSSPASFAGASHGSAGWSLVSSMATMAAARQSRRSPAWGAGAPAGMDARFSAGEPTVRGSPREPVRTSRRPGCSRPGWSLGSAAKGGARPPSGPASFAVRERLRGPGHGRMARQATSPFGRQSPGRGEHPYQIGPNRPSGSWPDHLVERSLGS